MSLPHLSLPASACVEIHADVHLQQGQDANFAAWQQTMLGSAADAIIILGDWFEVWVGDDWGLQDLFAQACAAVVRQCSAKRAVYFLPGNRDFLLGADFAYSCGLQILADPCLLELGGQRILLTHGDAWVSSDLEYQAFREQARSPAWQTAFLSRPLRERVQLGAAMRAQSQAAQAQRAVYDDIDLPLALAQLQAAGAHTLVHGHTHRPSCESLDADGQYKRWVLSDWDATHGRGDYLRIDAKGISRHPIQAASALA